MCREIRRTIPKVFDAEFLQNSKIVPPMLIVPGLREFVLADRFSVPLYGRVAVLDTSREHELRLPRQVRHRSLSEDVEAASVHDQGGSGDEASFRSSEEANSCSDVFGLPNRALDLLDAALDV